MKKFSFSILLQLSIAIILIALIFIFKGKFNINKTNNNYSIVREDFIRSLNDSLLPFNKNELKDKAIIINIWATWCGPCRQEIPALNTLVKENTNKNVVFLALSPENDSIVKKSMKKAKLDFNYTLINGDTNTIKFLRQLPQINDTNGYFPSHIFIDKNGNFDYFKIGYDAEIEGDMKQFIKMQ